MIGGYIKLQVYIYLTGVTISIAIFIVNLLNFSNFLAVITRADLTNLKRMSANCRIIIIFQIYSRWDHAVLFGAHVLFAALA